MLANLNDVLKDAQKNKYGVGLFNTIDSTMLDAVIDAAEETRSPVIIGTAEVLLPFGELKLIAPAMVAAAKRASVPVVVHYDHGLTFERCIEALNLGFTSIMFDGSACDYETNIANTREIVKIAHAMNVTVEGEIGHVGEAITEDNNNGDMYTTPEEAIKYVSDTGVDALAVSIGTAHGAYKSAPKLDIKRLADIHSKLDTPLVLHGGSGLTDNDFKNTIKNGISKVNIFTDLCTAGTNAMSASLKNGLSYCEARTEVFNSIKAEVIKKIKLFGSDERC